MVNIDDKVVSENLNKIKKFDLDELIENSHDDENIIVKYKNQVHNILPIADLKIIGEHNCVNARAAASACVVIGLEDEQIAEGLKTFNSLEHRLENCGIVAGIRLFNDSKATNVDSVLVAMDSFERGKAIFLLGGRDKNTSLDALIDKAKDQLKGVVCYGEAKERFASLFKEKINDSNFLIETAENLGGAFKTAMEKAKPGDFVVLSPACSSFDEFQNFEERGKVFKALVDKCKQNAG